MRYRGPPIDALVSVIIKPFVAVYHRPSGTTHLLTEPAPQILAALAAGPLDRLALLAALATAHELVDPDPEALAERLDELAAAGLIEAA